MYFNTLTLAFVLIFTYPVFSGNDLNTVYIDTAGFLFETQEDHYQIIDKPLPVHKKQMNMLRFLMLMEN